MTELRPDISLLSLSLHVQLVIAVLHPLPLGMRDYLLLGAPCQYNILRVIRGYVHVIRFITDIIIKLVHQMIMCFTVAVQLTVLIGRQQSEENSIMSSFVICSPPSKRPVIKFNTELLGWLNQEG
jgi:uncharacterized membrane protein AbrB (regulator of aidB expression)